MNCPLCGKTPLVFENRTDSYFYRGRSIDIPQSGDYCASCGEGFFSVDQAEIYLTAARDFRAKVDADPLPPTEIRKVRKRLKLTQKKAGEIFGGGIRAFSQYERGITRPGKAADTLLRLLDRHPELLAEISKAA
jgi:HTH-type transcriptional regulator/antitoxin MqsA